MNHRMRRREFLRMVGGAAAAGFVWDPLKAGAAVKLQPLAPGIKISLQISTKASDDDLRFAQQLGVEYVSIPTSGSKATAKNFIQLKQRVEAAGLKVWNIGNSNVHNMPEVTLNLPGRDKKIEEYKSYLRNLAQAGISYTTYAHMGNGIWSSGWETTRGGATARAFDMNKNPKGHWVYRPAHAWPPVHEGRIVGELCLFHQANRARGGRVGHSDRHPSR